MPVMRFIRKECCKDIHVKRKHWRLEEHQFKKGGVVPQFLEYSSHTVRATCLIILCEPFPRGTSGSNFLYSYNAKSSSHTSSLKKTVIFVHRIFFSTYDSFCTYGKVRSTTFVQLTGLVFPHWSYFYCYMDTESQSALKWYWRLN